MKAYLYLLSVLTFVTSCTSPSNPYTKDPKEFPEVQSLSEFPSTDFLTTLESKIDSKKNGIYAASLLMAWNEVRGVVEDSITEIENADLQIIDQSNSYKNVLAKDEYFASSTIEGDRIKAKAKFRKLLPFIEPFNRREKPMQFGDSNVTYFGFVGHHKSSNILYYNGDNDFGIRLKPKNREHEIWLIKVGTRKVQTISSELNRVTDKMKTFKENRNDKNFWKYVYNDEDEVRIPLISFNLQTNFRDIEGTHFSTLSASYVLDELYQRTAFVLDEKGAKVESEAYAEASEKMEEDLPKPKNLFFDSPYIILLKRKTAPNPYFAMYVANNELMVLLKK